MSGYDVVSPMGDFSADRWARCLAASGALTRESLPDDLVARDVARGEHIVRLRSGAWHGAGVARLRYTEISGLPGLYVMNIGLLPTGDRGLPMVHAEVVVVGGFLRVLILDAHGLGASAWPVAVASASSTLSELRRLPGIELADERPAWAADVISTDAVWASSQEPGALTTAAAGIATFLSWTAAVLESGWPPCDAAERERRRRVWREVRTTFLTHEPSRPFLRSMFGPEWAERYMAEFLFPDFESSHRHEAGPASAAGAIEEAS